MITKSEKEIMSTWKGTLDIPVVSIRCITYNHVNYLHQALDSFLGQITTFPFEIIVHDDASTDGTTEVLQEYAQSYPNIIFPIIQKENQYSKDIRIIRKSINEKIRGKYVALCEGDDYWIDAYKLQTQVDFMESHPNCVLSMHNGRLLNEKRGKLEKKINPYNCSGFLSALDVLVEKTMFPPTASIMYISEIDKNRPDEIFDAPVGDRPLRMYFLTRGDIYYSDKCMCVYRYNQGNESFGSRVKADPQYALRIYNEMVSFYYRYDEYTNNKYLTEMDILRSKEKYNYYIRIGEKDKAFETMYFSMYFPKKKRIMARARRKVLKIMPAFITDAIKKVMGF